MWKSFLQLPCHFSPVLSVCACSTFHALSLSELYRSCRDWTLTVLITIITPRVHGSQRWGTRAWRVVVHVTLWARCSYIVCAVCVHDCVCVSFSSGCIKTSASRAMNNERGLSDTASWSRELNPADMTSRCFLPCLSHFLSVVNSLLPSSVRVMYASSVRWQTWLTNISTAYQICCLYQHLFSGLFV